MFCSDELPIDDWLPRYDITRSYDWNYDNAPEPVAVDVPPFPGAWSLCGLPVNSPLGLPAGPLLNGAWVRYYASLGFDVLTYKTVRTSGRDCYPWPNLQPVATHPLSQAGGTVQAVASISGSWAVSFGMPSQAADIWRRDVEQTRRMLPEGKLLSVSIVGGTREDTGHLEELADDYARCAHWAEQSGADLVEANFSCPNVCSIDGQLYEQPESAGLVARKIRARLSDTPLILKVGYLPDRQLARQFLTAVMPHVQGLAMTNCIAAQVIGRDGAPRFDNSSRGIGGTAIRDASIAQVQMFRELIDEFQAAIELIGVGGAGSAADVHAYLTAGATGVHIATAAMIDPLTAIRIRRDWSHA